MKMYYKYGFVILILLFLINSCIIVWELVPKNPSPFLSTNQINTTPSDKMLLNDHLIIDSFFVHGYPEEHTPPLAPATPALEKFLLSTQGVVDLNRSEVFRVSQKNLDSPQRIIILVPGIFGGIGAASNLAKSIVKRNHQSQVWLWDRRSNQLEDRRHFQQALLENNPQILYDQLEEGQFKIKEDAYYQPALEDISFVGYWGLNVQLRDLFNIILEARNQADEVILAGYSLGVYYSTLFLANRFDEGAGYQFIDRVILLDGPPMIKGYVKNDFTYHNGATIVPGGYIDGLKKLQSGEFYPCNGDGTRKMDAFYLMELKALLAQIDPDGLSPVPYQISGKKIPITNLARFLVEQDDNYQKFKLFTLTAGLANAEHKGLFNEQDTVKITGLAHDADHISWISINKLPPDHPKEFNYHEEYLSAFSNLNFNMPEWYQPTRMLLDMGAIHYNNTAKGWQSKYFSITENKKVNRSVLAIGLARGLSSQKEIYQRYIQSTAVDDFTIIMLGNLTHTDGNSAGDRHSKQYVAEIITSWLKGRPISQPFPEE
ncbi:MAG: hypothetical protein MJB14_01410 [Spirochaetes bacterium]|nr:hypothetical protein [Spirochaetota bacterium]